VVAALRVLLCVYLGTWEPINLASEAVRAWPTLDARGGWAITELVVHAIFAVMAVAGGVALWNRSPHGVVLALLGVAASTARVIQVGKFTTLPHETSPDLIPIVSVAALVHLAFWSAVLTRYEDQFSDHRS
jgi:hypothetical protein